MNLHKMKKLHIVLLLGFLAIACSSNQNITVVSVEEGSKMIDNKKGLQILDVRTDGEFKQGHIQNSINLDIYDTENFMAGIEKLDKDEPVLVYCRSGKRSQEASALMIEHGFKQIYDLEGGILNWESTGKKTVKN